MVWYAIYPNISRAVWLPKGWKLFSTAVCVKLKLGLHGHWSAPKDNWELQTCIGIKVSVYSHTSSKLAPLSISKAASSTCPPQAARVRGDSKESAGMLTCAPLSNSSRATSTWPSWDSETHRECRDKHLNNYTGSLLRFTFTTGCYNLNNSSILFPYLFILWYYVHQRWSTWTNYKHIPNIIFSIYF